MSKLNMLPVLFAVSSVLTAAEVTPEYKIVTGKLNGAPETMTAPMLAEHLQKIFGRKIAVESGKPAPKTIFLNSNPKLKAEEWKITAKEDTVTIEGGFPRGVYYGACELLERFAGVRWFTPYETKIPKSAKIQIADGTYSGSPSFPNRRRIGNKVNVYANALFMSRNRLNFTAPDKQFPSQFVYLQLGHCHTFYKLTQNIPAELEECLPVDSRGNRGRGEGVQICYSNKKFREYSKKEVARWIKEGEARLNRNNPPVPFRYGVIDVSQNDNPRACQCKGCKALYKKYGSISGAQLEYINDIASAFPDRIIQTFAYMHTIEPPKGIKARENVMIQFAFLSADCMRPLSWKSNEKFRKYYQLWDPISPHKSVWAYHRLYSNSEMFETPQCCFWYIPEDTRFYHKFGIKSYYVETEYCYAYTLGRAFFDLHTYLTARMLNNIHADENEIIEEFMEFQYGPAAPEMKAYAAYLRKRYEAVEGKLCAKPIPVRSCFDLEFFKTVNALLDKAQAKAGKDKKLMERILIERLNIDLMLLNRWKQWGEPLKLDKKTVCKRAEKAIRIACKRYLPKNKNVLKTVLNKLNVLRNPIPIPPGMENLNIVQCPAILEKDKYTANDPDALFGRAAVTPKLDDKGKFNHNNPLCFGLYDENLKKGILGRKFKEGELKQDEKYHLYRIGSCKPDPLHKIVFWGHVSWRMKLTKMLRYALDPIDPDRELEIWISLKVTGPAYVKGSKSPNGVFVDKLVVVKK